MKVQNRKKVGFQKLHQALTGPKQGPIWPLEGVGEGKKQLPTGRG